MAGVSVISAVLNAVGKGDYPSSSAATGRVVALPGILRGSSAWRIGGGAALGAGGTWA